MTLKLKSRPSLNRWSLLRLLLSLLLILLVFSSLGQAIYLSAKAELSQHLLKTAWRESLEYKTDVKPWPWADIYPTAYLTVPELDIEEVVVSGHSGEALAFGPGLVQINNGTVLAGHRDSHFAFLENLQPGNRIEIQDRDGYFHRYEMTQASIIDIREQDSIQAPDGALVLITCYPFNALTANGPLRYLVFADVVDKQFADAGTVHTF